MNTATARLVQTATNNPAFLASGNAYNRYPERADWQEWQVYEDGSVKVRNCSRWGGVVSCEDWRPTQAPIAANAVRQNW